MPPASAPPNYYSNMAAIGGAGQPSPGAPAGGAPNPKTKELADAFKGIFSVMDKMKSMEPKLEEKFTEIKKQLMVAAADAKIDPQMLNSEEAAPAAVEGNASPGEPGATPPPPSAESNEAKPAA